jgi:hypothetical protein
MTGFMDATRRSISLAHGIGVGEELEREFVEEFRVYVCWERGRGCDGGCGGCAAGFAFGLFRLSLLFAAYFSKLAGCHCGNLRKWLGAIIL